MDTEGVLFNAAELWFLLLIYFEVFPSPSSADTLFYQFITLLALALFYMIPVYVVWRVWTGKYPSDVLPNPLLRSQSDDE